MSMTWMIWLQAATDIAAEPDGPEKLRVIEMLWKGGLIMIPILILSVMAVYIFIERYLTIKQASRIDDGFMGKIREYVLAGNVQAARALCASTDSPIARMVEKGIMRLGKPLKNINVAVENVGNLEVYNLERRLATLATIAGAAPMIGFLGTVLGMIRVFFDLNTAGNNIDPGMLAGGIYQAMVTTAAGLTVGIVALIGYNYLVSQVEKVVHRMEASSMEFLDLLQEPIK